MKIRFPKLEPWQQPVFDDIRDGFYDYFVVKAKRQIGKSILGIVCLLYFAFENEGSISVMIEPTLKQSRRIYKQLIRSVGGERSGIIKSANAQLLEIEFVNGSSIVFGSAEQADALRGITVKRGILIIDEASFIKDDIFEILAPVVDANKAPVLYISTPLFADGEFYRKYMEGLDPGQAYTKSYDWSLFDTSKYLPPEKLEYYRGRLSPVKFRCEYLGEFAIEGTFLFGDLSPVTGGYSKESPVVAGIDWSVGKKGDYTVLTFMDDTGAVTKIDAWNNIKPVDLIDVISERVNASSIHTLEIEINSIGEVYSDMLKRKVRSGINIVEFITSNESKRRIIEQLIAGVQTSNIKIPDDPELLSELSHYNVEKTTKGYTYNGESGYHDDYVMSLAFAYDAWQNNNNQFNIVFV